MPRYTNPYDRLGNKTNDIKFFKSFLPLDSKIIVEPFCGTCAISRKVYSDTNKYEYHFNDLDYDVFFVMNEINLYSKKKNELIDECNNEFLKKNKTVFDFTRELKNRCDKTDDNDNNKIIDRCIYNSITTCKYVKLHKSNTDPNDILMFNKAIKTNLDYKIILNKYIDNKEAFLFLDPPYLFSNNKSYIPQSNCDDMTGIIIEILEYLKKAKCKVMLIINKLAILDYLFKDFIKSEYDKIYQLSKKKTKHLIITNY